MPVHFLDAREGHCRFPLWGDDAAIGNVCGERALPSKPYCPACFARTHSATPPRVPFVPRERNVAPMRAEDVTPEIVELVA